MKTFTRRDTGTAAVTVGAGQTAKRATAAVAALAIASSAALVGAPSAAAEDPTQVKLSYYATSFIGNVHWFNRSVQVDGLLRALPGSCRRVWAATMTADSRQLDARSTSLQCGTSEKSLTVPADVPGGAAKVQFIFKGPNDEVLDACVAYIGDEFCD
ncbi:hypothetical protein [Amycolatopsis coloradensis]|uniref:hypothetical protein n=1 Tax=Amycolatopsis coloradensis TaxID=76021 RepID=UPI001177DDF5|nr:hypothetical protein [Amycolatopsis coloradensis]